MAKSADAFRTISEVADWLETPAHVLRFWESKFSQVKPVKRAGGRRYYRPSDMQLLGGIKKLLHDDGMTIKGVQKLLREQGVKHVAALSQSLDELTEIEASEMAFDVTSEAEVEATVLSFKREANAPEEPAASGAADGPFTAPSEPETTQDHGAQQAVLADDGPAKTDPDLSSEAETEAKTATGSDQVKEPPVSLPPAPETEDTAAAPMMPSFLRTRTAEAPATTESAPSPALRVDVPEDPEDHVPAPSGVLGLLAAQNGDLPAERIAAIRAVAERLKSLRG